MFTKQHYEAIAEVFANLDERTYVDPQVAATPLVADFYLDGVITGVSAALDGLTRLFVQDNPAFDVIEFAKASTPLDRYKQGNDEAYERLADMYHSA